MKVKVKNPAKVYFDRTQQLVFTGDKPIETKVTAEVRQLLNQGVLIEVVEPVKEIVVEEKVKATVGKSKVTTETKTTEKA